MDRVVGLRYWRAADAQVVVEAWKRSDETLTEFARRHGIQPRRLGRWAAALQVREDEIRFHPVWLVGRDDGGRRRAERIEIVTSGHRVRVPAGFAAEDLERVLTVLRMGA